jgi:translation elongation factor EF-1alpha
VGLIRPIPAHYKAVGLIDDYWEKASALGLRMESGVLRAGDRIAYELPVGFIEDDVTSLQLNDQDVQEAHAGDYVGLKTKLGK